MKHNHLKTSEITSVNDLVALQARYKRRLPQARGLEQGAAIAVNLYPDTRLRVALIRLNKTIMQSPETRLGWVTEHSRRILRTQSLYSGGQTGAGLHEDWDDYGYLRPDDAYVIAIDITYIDTFLRCVDLEERDRKKKKGVGK